MENMFLHKKHDVQKYDQNLYWVNIDVLFIQVILSVRIDVVLC